MRLPFTADQFLAVFRSYNTAVWPAQVLLYALALTALVLAFRYSRRSGKAISLILAVLWLWMGVVYHLGFFRAINPAAVVFGVAFVVQAALFGWLGARRRPTTYAADRTLPGIAGGVLIAYALVVYPLLGRALGHPYPSAPTFGLPCPTTIFTLGMLLWARTDVPGGLLAVPLLWSIVGTSAAVQLDMREDYGLAAAAIVMVVVTAYRAVASHGRTEAREPALTARRSG